MIPLNETPELNLHVERFLPAPPARAFRAWTVPGELKRWWGADEGYTTPVAEVDLRVGGAWRIEIQPPEDADRIVIYGEYLEIHPDKKLVFTWRWVGMEESQPDTRVTILFEPHPRGATIKLAHERFVQEPAKIRHENGWHNILNDLAAVLAAH